MVTFATAQDAERRVAGVAAAARIVRELAAAGFAGAWLALPEAKALGADALRDVDRLRGSMPVDLVEPGIELDGEIVRLSGSRLVPARDLMTGGQAARDSAGIALDGPRAAAEILRTTGKPTDGVVSRWLNRPISRRLSGLLLRFDAIRPIHATVGTALLAVLMFAALVLGGEPGLIAGAFLFHAASVFDGVDGEIARATFRTSRNGAALDSTIDMATNVAAMLGLAINLGQRGQPEAGALVVWGLSLLLLGLAMIGWRSLRQGGFFGFDVVKHDFRDRFRGPVAARLMALATIGTSRDFCALVYLLLVVAGIPMAGLYLFAVVTPIWILFVIGSLHFDPARSLASRRA